MKHWISSHGVKLQFTPFPEAAQIQGPDGEWSYWITLKDLRQFIEWVDNSPPEAPIETVTPEPDYVKEAEAPPPPPKTPYQAGAESFDETFQKELVESLGKPVPPSRRLIREDKSEPEEEPIPKAIRDNPIPFAEIMAKGLKKFGLKPAKKIKMPEVTPPKEPIVLVAEGSKRGQFFCAHCYQTFITKKAFDSDDHLCLFKSKIPSKDTLGLTLEELEIALFDLTNRVYKTENPELDVLNALRKHKGEIVKLENRVYELEKGPTPVGKYVSGHFDPISDEDKKEHSISMTHLHNRHIMNEVMRLYKHIQKYPPDDATAEVLLSKLIADYGILADD